LTWIQCSEVQRTPITTHEIVRLLLVDEVNQFELSIPDMSGESLLEFLADRQWPESFQALLDSSVGVLLFINPTTVVEPAWIFEIEVPDQGDGDQADVAEDDVETWSVRNSPTQAQLVDLLQIIDRMRHSAGPLPIALIASAWDVLAEDYHEPGEWVTDRMPLLDQFLKSNASRFPYQLFGVSAQGGELPRDKKALLEKDPSQKVWIVPGPSRESTPEGGVGAADRHDITLPIRWVMRAGDHL
jgi:hypothetical protein